MKKLTMIFTALLLLTVPLALTAEEEGEGDFEGELTIGGHIGDITDYGGKVGEYEQVPEDGRPYGKLKLELNKNDVYWDLSAKTLNTHDQDYNTYLDLKRVLQVHYQFHNLPHWLDNDPLANLESKAGGKFVTHENLEVDADYMIRYGEHEADFKIAPPSLPNFTFDFGYRNQTRQGHRQARSVSHCANCHVVGQGREINESTTDLTAGTTMRAGLLTMDYQFMNRKFTEDGPEPSMHYDLAQHPVRGPVWTNPDTGDTVNYGELFSARLGWDDEARVIDMVPDTDKNSHKVRAKVDMPGNSAFVASIVSSAVENQFTGLQSDSASFHGLYTNRWGDRNRWRFNAKLRHYTLDNDDVFVDVENSEAYESRWGGSFDWLRQSSLNRDVTSATADLGYRANKKVNLRGGLEWKAVDREHYYVTESDTKTVSNRFFATAQYRPHRKFRAWLRAEHSIIDNPFASPKAVCESDIDDPAYAEYYLRDQFRTGDVAAQPNDKSHIRFTSTWTATPKTIIGLNLRWVDQSNDDLTYTDWKRSLLQPGLTLNWAMSQKVVFNAGYLRIQEDTDGLYSITVMDG